ncbi:hypothetical protein HanIR_Chr08g0352671 [Helianthus annuus]|nr:hypothetical protein HanIR_Chr08g0352671 [Helianthus annuus]
MDDEMLPTPPAFIYYFSRLLVSYNIKTLMKKKALNEPKKKKKFTPYVFNFFLFTDF